MHPAARVQTAIELLDAILLAARDGGAAADVIATRFFKERRYAGSKDRRAIRDLAWRAIRAFGERPHSARAAMVRLADDDAELAAAFTGEGRAPAPVKPGEPRAGGGPLPIWLRPMLDPVIGGDDAEIAALLDRAPLDLRVNAARITGDIALPDGAALPAPLSGLRLTGDTPILDHPAYAAGAIDVQDAGSQWIVHACAARPGMTVVDLCAGAGGKTLALAEAMAGQPGGDGRRTIQGRLIACDTDRRRLGQLAPRAERAGIDGIETRLLDAGRESAALTDLIGRADRVLVDAPCSGTGTWRRNPEGRWRITPGRLDRLTALQSQILAQAATLVTKGGALVYAVCSLTTGEGAGQVASFLSAHADWGNGPAWPGTDDAHAAYPGRPSGGGIILSPLRDGTDGFFFARLVRS